MPRTKKNAKKSVKLGHQGDEMKNWREGKTGPKMDKVGQGKKQRKKVGKLKHSSRQYGHHATKGTRRKSSRKR